MSEERMRRLKTKTKTKGKGPGSNNREISPLGMPPESASCSATKEDRRPVTNFVALKFKRQPQPDEAFGGCNMTYLRRLICEENCDFPYPPWEVFGGEKCQPYKVNGEGYVPRMQPAALRLSEEVWWR